MKEKLIIGIDIGGTNFRIGAVDRENRVLNFSRRPVSSVLKGGDTILRVCNEILAGGKYLARLRQESYPDTPIEELFTRHGEEPLLQQFVDRMAQAVSTELTILDPDYVLIGGGVPAMKAFPREKLNERIAAPPLTADFFLLYGDCCYRIREKTPRRSSMEFENKVVVVTGGARGIICHCSCACYAYIPCPLLPCRRG